MYNIKKWFRLSKEESKKGRILVMKNFFNEFKKFISRGNVMDMAVGIIIGGAFTSIVTSLVNDIINPILGVFGGMNFDQLSVKLFGEATLYYGKFLTAVVNFLIDRKSVV